jgi:hypothetical protein
MEKSLVEKIDGAAYHGRDGAVATSRRTLKSRLVSESNPYTKAVYMLEHVNVLYSAMTSSANSVGVLAKIRALWYAFLATKTVIAIEQIRQIEWFIQQFGPGGYHVIMSVWARDMQIARRLRLLRLFPSIYQMLYAKMITAYNMIGRIAATQKVGYEKNDSADLTPAERTHLLGATLLYELSKEGLYTYPTAQAADELCRKVEWFCLVRHRVGFTGREEVQLVCRLLRAIGKAELSADIARRHGTADQLAKSGG